MILNKEILDVEVNTNYNKWIDDTCRLLTNEDKDTATDIINDILLSLYERLKSSDLNINNVSGYIFTSAKFCVISKSSKYQRTREKNRLFIPLDYATDVTDDEDENEENYCFADIQDALNESPFTWSEKEIYLRKNLECKSTTKMAKDIGVSRGRIAYRYGKVRNFLKKYFKHNGKKKEKY